MRRTRNWLTLRRFTLVVLIAVFTMVLGGMVPYHTTTMHNSPLLWWYGTIPYHRTTILDGRNATTNNNITYYIMVPYFFSSQSDAHGNTYAYVWFMFSTLYNNNMCVGSPKRTFRCTLLHLIIVCPCLVWTERSSKNWQQRHSTTARGDALLFSFDSVFECANDVRFDIRQQKDCSSCLASIFRAFIPPRHL